LLWQQRISDYTQPGAIANAINKNAFQAIYQFFSDASKDQLRGFHWSIGIKPDWPLSVMPSTKNISSRHELLMGMKSDLVVVWERIEHEG
jgi:hypothetical protein